MKVDSSGYYNFKFRVATNNPSGGPFTVMFNDVAVISGIIVDKPAGWANFRTLDAGAALLSESDSVMTLDFGTGGFNVGDIIITPTISPVSVDQIHTQFTPSLYPNPTSDMVYIKSADNIKSLQLADLSGRLLLHIETDEKSHQTSMNISAVDSGLYLVILESDTGEFSTQKLLISR